MLEQMPPENLITFKAIWCESLIQFYPFLLSNWTNLSQKLFAKIFFFPFLFIVFKKQFIKRIVYGKGVFILYVRSTWYMRHISLRRFALRRVASRCIYRMTLVTWLIICDYKRKISSDVTVQTCTISYTNRIKWELLKLYEPFYNYKQLKIL